jgi:predicted CXXCH cytochrome family protein
MNGRWLALGLCSLVAIACAGILGVRQPPARAFEHRAHVVRGIACVKCHSRVARSDANAALDLPGRATCVSCHDKPHDTRECSLCHGREDTRHAVAQAKQHLSYSHAAHAVHAEMGATTGQCTRCHSGVATSDGPLRPTMATCLGCHEHRAQWAARSCTPCHRNLESEAVRPESHVVHGRDFMRRHGEAAASARDLCSSCHSESECAACHGVAVPALPSTWHFDRPHTADMHAAGFLARHSIEARIDPATCTSCHRDQSYCESCHRERGLLAASATRSSPHPPDWLSTAGRSRHGSEARRNPASCASCHGGAGESLCVGCHRVGGPGGNPHPPGFSASKRISELPCRMCHEGAP